MPIEIKLTNSDKAALIDEADYDLVKDYVWWEHFPKQSETLSYAYGMKLPRTRTGERVVKMHRLLLKITDSKQLIDHVDGNGLNNCRSNLQLVTMAENIQKANFDPTKNKRKRHSKFRGVSYLEWYGKYLAYVNCNGKREYLGYFTTAEEAARVRDSRAKQLHGKFARLNYEDTPVNESPDNT